MNEEQWLACTDPMPMLEFLRGNVSDRKWRLLMVACCRHFWRKLKDKRSRQAVAVGECYADGLAGKEELDRAGSAAVAANNDAVGWDAATRTGQKDWDAPTYIAWCAVREKAEEASTGLMPACWLLGSEKRDASRERVRQSCLLREFFGNPFRPSPSLDPFLFKASDGLVVKLARAAYDERTLPQGTFDPTRLHILADALEEAGSSDAVLLGHLRSEGPHYRGCAVVDVVLGRS